MMRERTARIRFVAFLLASFAVLGVLFAIAGVYGTVSLDVSRRIREVGVRIALGASNTAVAVSTLRRGLQPVLVGALAGLAAAFWTAPALESVLYGVPARDPISAIAGVAILLLAGALACVLPAHRAARTDPASILRAS
jgi:ABC-type antimicrobial peptide transport system permease subunit